MQFHTGMFHCCQCCTGMYAVHCCGECCKGTELGWGVQVRLECTHPCVKGAMRHDQTAIKKRAQSKGRGTQELEDWHGMPKGGVGRWGCCGGGCLTLSCHIRSASVSQQRDEMVATPSPSPQNNNFRGTPPLHTHGSSPSTPSMSPSPQLHTLRNQQSIYNVVDMSIVGLPDSSSNPATTPSRATLPAVPVSSPVPNITDSVLSISLCEECCLEPGVVWCCSCEALFCKIDFETAHRTKIGKRHFSVPISYQPSRCLEHLDQYAILYCIDCKTDICRMCCCGPLQGRHTNHEVVNLGVAEHAAKELIKSKIEVIRSSYRDLTETHSATIKKKQEIRGSVEDVKQEVSRFFNSAAATALRAIEKRKTELLSEIDRLTVPTVASVMTREVGLYRGIKSCQETCVAIDAALTTNKVLQMRDNLLGSIDTSLAAIQPLSFTDDSVSELKVFLKTPEIDLSTSLENIIQSYGEVNCEGIVNTVPLETNQSKLRSILVEDEYSERSVIGKAIASFNDLASVVASPASPEIVRETPSAQSTPTAKSVPIVASPEIIKETLSTPTTKPNPLVESIQKDADTTLDNENILNWCELCELETTPGRCEYCDSLCIKNPDEN